MPATPQSQQTKTTINQEEARTELLATLAAARELGPDMDETLAGRYVERLDVLFPDKTRDSDRLRGEVKDLIASARGHGADADSARVQDFVARALAPRPAPPVPVRPPGPPMNGGGRPGMYVPMIICIAVFIALAVATHGATAWLIFLLPMIIWGGNRNRRRMRYRRYGYWDGYGPTMPGPDPRRQLPPGDGPEIL
jgi:hypothetical protein